MDKDKKKKRVIELTEIPKGTKEYDLAFIQFVEKDEDRDFVVVRNGMPLTGKQRRTIRREMIRNNMEANKINLRKILGL